jgi:hypothetical protein
MNSFVPLPSFHRRRLPAKVLVAASLLSLCSFGGLQSAHAHARLVEPKPRDNSTFHKDLALACGGQPDRAANQPLTRLVAGQTYTIRFEETVNHAGCFLLDLSVNGDTDWQALPNGNVKHVGTPPNPSDRQPRPYVWTGVLPNVTCDTCTIRLRQIMLATETAPCPPNQLTIGSTYFSCANVAISAAAGNPPPPPPGPSPDAGISGDTARPVIVPGSDAAGGGTPGSGGTGGPVSGAGGTDGGAGATGDSGISLPPAAGTGGATGAGGGPGMGTGGGPAAPGPSGGPGGTSPGSTAPSPPAPQPSGGCSFARRDGQMPAAAALLVTVVAGLLRRDRRRRA